MSRIFLALCFVLFSLQGFAQTNHAIYQIDLIVFTHAYTPAEQVEQPLRLSSALHETSGITLQPKEPGGAGLYRLMPTSSSSLQGAWSRLNKQSHYHTLLHYTWLQPSHSQRPITLSAHTNSGWAVDGTLRVRQSNYYLLDTELRFSSPYGNRAAFVFSQKQRLKPGKTYYLDHPQAGMLINVHRVA